jgi:cholesterol transport system auxiliary component
MGRNRTTTTRPSAAGRTGARALAAALAVGLAGCSLLGGNKEPTTIYAPEPRVATDPSWPTVDWQLVVAQPQASRMVDSSRIAVRPTPGELQVYKGVSWSRPPTQQLEDLVVRTLEDSGRIAGVARSGSSMAADHRLEMDVRRYEADYAGAAVPSATIEVNVKLLGSIDQKVVGSRTFLQAVPAAGTDPALVAQAFGEALGKIAHDVSGWVLEAGAAEQRENPR